MRSARSLRLVPAALLVFCLGCDADEPTNRVDPGRSLPSLTKGPPTTPSDKPSKQGGGDKKDKPDEPRVVEVPGGATLTSLPPRAEEICAQGPPLSRTCPRYVPLVRRVSYVVDTFGRPGGRFQVLELAAGAPSNKDFSRNAPPRVAHVVVEVGKPKFLIDLGEPYPNKIPLSLLLGEQLDQAQYVAPEESWKWNEVLVLAPSFPSGGAHADHLVYSWKERGLEHVVSLHAWEPATEAVRTLHAIVRSIRTR